MQGDSVYEFVLQLEISPNALVLILPFKVKKKKCSTEVFKDYKHLHFINNALLSEQRKN